MIKNIHKSENPREKALKYGIDSLSNSELLSIIIRHGTVNNNVLEVADNLIINSAGFENIFNLDFEDLINISGIGKVKALELLAVFEISKRLKNNFNIENVFLWTYNEVFKFITNNKFNRNKEHFWFLIFNKNNKLLKLIHFSGSHDKLLINNNKLLKHIINFENTKVIIAHNHPSGISRFSESDKKTTLNLKKKFNVFNIELINHILFFNDKYKLFWYNNIRYF